MIFAFAFITGIITGALTVIVLLEARYRKTSIQYAKPAAFKPEPKPARVKRSLALAKA